MSAGESAIATMIGRGDYFEALGVRRATGPTDIAVAAARLAAEHPDDARRISAIASVLRDPEQRKIYLIAREERDNVLRYALEPQLHEALADLPQRVWSELQRLLRSQFELGEVKIGPRGARSLAQRHEWIREAVVNSSFSVLAPSQAERRVGVARRTITQNNCATCGGLARETCDCQDSYDFSIPTGAAPGALLGAYGYRTGRFSYLILDRAVPAPRPYLAVNGIYLWYRERMGTREDVTLEEAQARVHRWNMISMVGYAALGVLIGLLVSSWPTGLIAAAAGIAVMAVNRFRAPHARMTWTATGVLLAIQPIVGALAGKVLATTVSGLITGLILGVVVFLLYLLSRRIRT